MKTRNSDIQRIYRHQRIRKRISGNALKPRVCVHRSLKNLSVQLIDDTAGKVIFGMSTMAEPLRKKLKSGGNVNAASVLGEAFAAEAQKKGFKKISFDRGGYLYHGRVKAFADAARKAGMEF